jgi:multidrug resistance efflux pump
MIAFLLTIYIGFAVLLFKFKLLKPRPYPIAFTIVGGVIIIVGVTAAWMQFAPLSPKAVTTQYVISLVPYVKGQVKKVNALANQPLKKGDLLLEIDPEPYQNAVDQARAQLAAAKANVQQSTAGADAADAAVAKAKAGIAQSKAAFVQSKAAVATAQAASNKAKAADDLAKTQERIALDLQKKDAGAISVLKVQEATQNRAAADAALDQAESGVAQARAAEQQSEALIDSAEASQMQATASAQQARFTIKAAENTVLAIQAQTDNAVFNLAQCRMLAPADGYVVNWQVQEGTMLVPIPLAAAGTFICTADTAIIAVFPQNYLGNVETGNDVELILDPYPGRLFKGKVDTVITATG